MHNNKKILGWAALLLAGSQLATAAELGNSSFISDSSLSVLNRNYYYNHDNHATDGKDGREWGHSILADFKSGFTEGTVGVGFDLHAYTAFKLDSGRGRNRTDLFPIDGSNGSSRDNTSSAGGSVKARISKTQLNYGDLRPYNPVFAVADPRLTPATVRGYMLTSNELDNLSLDAGHFASGKDYNQSNRANGFYAAYAGIKGGNVSYLGGSYQLSDLTSLTLYSSKYTDLWRQHYLNANHDFVINPERKLNLDFNFYRSSEQGKARAGNINVNAWSMTTAYVAGAHTYSLGYQKIHGDQPLDYLGMDGGAYHDSIYLGNASQYADFNGPNEKSWLVGYAINMASYGWPGATLSLRHVRGSGIDGSKNSPNSPYSWYGKNDKHHTTDLDARYVIQSGPAKDLSIRVRHARHRMTSGKSDVDADRFRLVIEYPLNIF